MQLISLIDIGFTAAYFHATLDGLSRKRVEDLYDYDGRCLPVKNRKNDAVLIWLARDSPPIGMHTGLTYCLTYYEPNRLRGKKEPDDVPVITAKLNPFWGITTVDVVCANLLSGYRTTELLPSGNQLQKRHILGATIRSVRKELKRAMQEYCEPPSVDIPF